MPEDRYPPSGERPDQPKSGQFFEPAPPFGDSREVEQYTVHLPGALRPPVQPPPPPQRATPKGLYTIVGLLTAMVITLVIMLALLLPRVLNGGSTGGGIRAEPQAPVTATVTVPAPIAPSEATRVGESERTPGDDGDSPAYTTLYETRKVSIPDGGCYYHHLDLDEPRVDPESGSELTYSGCADDSGKLHFSDGINITTTVDAPSADGCAGALQTSAANHGIRPVEGMRICAQTNEELAGNLVLIEVMEIKRDGTVVLALTGWAPRQ